MSSYEHALVHETSEKLCYLEIKLNSHYLHEDQECVRKLDHFLLVFMVRSQTLVTIPVT